MKGNFARKLYETAGAARFKIKYKMKLFWQNPQSRIIVIQLFSSSCQK
jgi:hypothetical protein